MVGYGLPIFLAVDKVDSNVPWLLNAETDVSAEIAVCFFIYFYTLNAIRIVRDKYEIKLFSTHSLHCTVNSKSKRLIFFLFSYFKFSAILIYLFGN